MATQQQLPEAVQEIIDDSTKALRADKDTEGHIGINDARTAARYLGQTEDVHKFQIVSTRVQSFPEGVDMTGIHTQESVAKWARAQDPEIIDAADEDGFEEVDDDDW